MWITRISIGQPVFATMVMLALVVLGVFSYHRLPVEQMPDVDSPLVSVMLRYPGASPEAIENDLLKPIENAINTVDGIQRIYLDGARGRRLHDGRVPARHRHGRGDAGAARQDRAARSPTLPARRQGPAGLAHQRAGQRAAGGEPLDALEDALAARALDPGRPGGGEAPAERGRRGQRRGQRRRGAPDQGAAAARADARARRGRRRGDRRRSGPRTRTCRPARSGAATASSWCAWRAASRTRASSAASSSPRAAARCTCSRAGCRSTSTRSPRSSTARPSRESIARLNGAPALGLNIFKVQGSNVVAVGDGVREAMEELRRAPAAGRRVHDRAVERRAHQVAARQRQEDHPRGRGAHGVHRVPVPALVALHGHHRAHAADLGDRDVHRAVRLRFHAELRHADGAQPLHRPADRRRHRGAREHRAPPRHGQEPPRRGARGHGGDRARGDGHHLRDPRGVRAGGFHGRLHRSLFLPVRHHDRGGGAGVAVRELHARPDAVLGMARSGAAPFPPVPVARDG